MFAFFFALHVRVPRPSDRHSSTTFLNPLLPIQTTTAVMQH